jgi:F-type H+-transporting ATPase subunit delta
MTNVTVTSAIKLSSGQTEKLKKAVGKKYGKDVTYQFIVDPGIFGGVIVTVNSKQLDGSLKTKLDKVKQELHQKIMRE